MQTEETKLQRIKLFHETQTIASQLPINIDGFEIEELLVRCEYCNASIPPELIHGYANKPLPNTASFQTIFVCPNCRYISESVQRLKKTGEHTIAVDKLSPNGKWLHSEMSLKEDHWLVKAVKWLLGKQ